MKAVKSAKWVLIGAILTILALNTVTAHASPETVRVVLIPDTQNYARVAWWAWASQMNWIRDNAGDIDFAIHLGDIVENPYELDEWNVAFTEMLKIDGVVPYSVLPGNHDNRLGGAMNATVNYTNYELYFGLHRFPNTVANFPEGSNANNYHEFADIGLLNLEYVPSTEALAWANGIVSSNPDRRFIVATHSYLHSDGERTSYAGQQVWDELIRHHDNIFLVVGGHSQNAYDPVINKVRGDNGNVVYELLVNYQNVPPTGGESWLLILDISQDNIVATEYAHMLSAYDKTIDFNVHFELRGDADDDGDVDIFDALLVQRYISGESVAINLHNAAITAPQYDVVDAFDALFIAQYVAGQRSW